MAVETELYLIYPEEILEEWGVAPCVITTREDFIRRGIEEGDLQDITTKSQRIMRVMRITEAESMYKITPEAQDEEVDEEWRDTKFSLPFFDSGVLDE